MPHHLQPLTSLEDVGLHNNQGNSYKNLIQSGNCHCDRNEMAIRNRFMADGGRTTETWSRSTELPSFFLNKLYISLIVMCSKFKRNLFVFTCGVLGLRLLS